MTEKQMYKVNGKTFATLLEALVYAKAGDSIIQKNEWGTKTLDVWESNGDKRCTYGHQNTGVFNGK